MKFCEKCLMVGDNIIIRRVESNSHPENIRKNFTLKEVAWILTHDWKRKNKIYEDEKIFSGWNFLI